MRIAPLLIALALLLPLGAAGPSPTDSPGDVLARVATRAGLDIPGAATPEEATLRDAILAHYALVGAVPTAAGLAKLDASLATVPADVQGPVSRLLVAMDEAARMRHDAFSRVSVEDARFAAAATLRTPTPDERARLAELATRMDLPRMVAAARLTLDATAQARAELAAVDPEVLAGVAFVDPLGSIEISGTTNDVLVANRTLQVDLGGDDWWQNNAGASMPDFVIEAFPGCITTGGLDCTPLSPNRNGNSLESVFGRKCSFDATQAPFIAQAYLGDVDAHVQQQMAQQSLPALQRFVTGPTAARAGELAASPRPDTGCAPDGTDAWTQDFVTKGILGDGDEHVVALALDLAGNDRYAPLREFNDINDGDNAAGCDTRPLGDAGALWNRNLTAGSAFAGIGLLWDADGEDFYGGRSLTQGVGHMGAVGVLVDEGADPDEYSGVRLAQGAGIFVALGLLLDDGGDDRYALENDAPFFNEFEHFIGCDVSTRDGQGRANFNAIGALVDLAGNDAYFVQDHADDVPGASRDDPTTTQGSTGTRLNIGPSPVNGAAALGLGLLWDLDGRDTYTRPGRADGVTDEKGLFVDGPVLPA